MRLFAWLVHLFTASGAVVGLLSIESIHNRDFISAFWYMALAIMIDAIDGTFARWFDVRTNTPNFDGSLLDNIVDFVNYVTVPAFFILVSEIVPAPLSYLAVSILIFSSAYQFSQTDAKTADHFFNGFPSYWNIVIFYLFISGTGSFTNLFIIALCGVLSFIPITYIYPTRMDCLFRSEFPRFIVLLLTIVWGISCLIMLWSYPRINPFIYATSYLYVIFYLMLSFWHSWITSRVKQVG